MAQDIRNFLEDRDFAEAAAEPRRDKIRRHIRRHRPAYAAGLLIVCFSGLAAAGSIYGMINAREVEAQQARADAATARSESQAARVRELVDVMLIDLHDAVQRLPAATEARQIILETASSYLEEISREEGADDPLVLQQLARAHDRIGDLLGGVRGATLGDLDAAMDHYTQARRIRDGFTESQRSAVLPGIAANHMGVADVWLQDRTPAAATRTATGSSTSTISTSSSRTLERSAADA